MRMCAVSGCNKPGTEVHHWAPVGLFGSEAECWPTGYLCWPHHDYWHQVTGTTAGDYPHQLRFGSATTGRRGADLMFAQLCRALPKGLSAGILGRQGNYHQHGNYTDNRRLLEVLDLARTVSEGKKLVTYSTLPIRTDPSAWLALKVRSAGIQRSAS